MSGNLLLGKLSSPTTGIFPGQAPAMGVYASISTAAPSVCVCVLMSCTTKQISAINVRMLCKSCMSLCEIDVKCETVNEHISFLSVCVKIWLFQCRHDTEPFCR